CLLIAAGCTAASFAVEPSGEPASVTAETLMSVVKVIERHHIDPPPKQELARWMLQGLAAQLEAPPPLGLGRRLSEVSSDEALAAEMQELCSELLAVAPNGVDDNETLQNIIAIAVRDALGLLPGTNRLTDSSAHRAQ